MSSGRLSRDGTAALEELEGELGLLGNALVLLSLVDERIAVTRHHSGLDGLLTPAVEDIERVRMLIRKAQVVAQSRRRLVTD